MQSDTSARYIHSVSDLCGADEIEFLLEDIRDLEPTSYKANDIQDFEIAGSQTDGVGALEAIAAALSADDVLTGTGVDRLTTTDQSPLNETIHSWDSHVNYQLRLDASSPQSLYDGVILYCDHMHLVKPIGFIRALILLSSISCLCCLCSAGTVHVGLFLLPLLGRIRLMLFITTFTILITTAILLLDITQMVYLFPFNWSKVNMWLYLGISIVYFLSASLILHMVTMSESYAYVAKHTKVYFIIAGGLGYLCCLETAILTTLHSHKVRSNYDLVSDEVQFTLQERGISSSCGIGGGTESDQLGMLGGSAGGSAHTHLQQSQSVIYFPPSIPSTSKQAILLKKSSSRHSATCNNAYLPPPPDGNAPAASAANSNWHEPCCSMNNSKVPYRVT